MATCAATTLETEPFFVPLPCRLLLSPFFSRLAVGCKHLNLFIREEQAAAFSASYKTLPVHTTTLRNLGNFKGVVLAEVKKINGISQPRAFCLRKDGEQRVTVGMKNFMHDEVFTGMPLPGVFSGEPHQLFIGSVPIVEAAPAFNLKPVKPKNPGPLRLRSLPAKVFVSRR